MLFNNNIQGTLLRIHKNCIWFIYLNISSHYLYYYTARYQNGGGKLKAEAVDKPVLEQEYWLIWTADANEDDFANDNKPQQLFKPR